MDTSNMGSGDEAPHDTQPNEPGEQDDAQALSSLTPPHSPEPSDAPNATEDEDEEEEEGPESFWSAVRDKMISWGSMQPPLRLITGIAIAQLVGAAAIIALHSVPSAQINMGLQSGHAIHMAVPYFWIGVVFMWIAISFLMTGALMLRWPIRLLALALFTGFTLFSGALPSYAWARIAAVVILWVWAGFVTLARRSVPPSTVGQASPPGHVSAWAQRTPLTPITLVIVLLAQGAIDVAILASTSWTQSPTDLIFQLTIESQLQLLAFALIPFLVLAGSDFAELGQLLGDGIAHATALKNARRGRWLTLGVTTLVALGIALTNTPSYPGNPKNTALSYLGEIIMGGVIALALSALLRWGRATRWPSARLGALTLLLTSLGYIAMFLVISAVMVAQNVQTTTVTLSDFQVYRTPQAQRPAFSLPYPAGWKPSLQSTPDETLLTVNGFSQQYPGVMFVESHPVNGATAEAAAQNLATLITNGVASGRALHVDATGVDGAWRTERFTLNGSTAASGQLEGEGWSLAENGRVWAIVGVAPASYASVLLPAFQSAVHLWRADRTAQTPAAAEAADLSAAAMRNAAIYLGLVPLLVGLALGFWFVRWRGKRSPMMRAAGVFIAAFGLILGAQAAPTLFQMVGAPRAWVWYLGLPISNLQQTVAIATLVLVGYIALRRRTDERWSDMARLALALNIGLLFISFMVGLYDRAIGLSKSSSSHPISWAEALIVVIALGWDLLMSGEAFTNHDTRSLPRHARLLLYMGYIMLTATLVMFFSTQSYTFASEAHDALFESEPWPQLGVHVLGLPMVIGAFALGVAAWVGRRRVVEAEEKSLAVTAHAARPSESASGEM